MFPPLGISDEHIMARPDTHTARRWTWPTCAGTSCVDSLLIVLNDSCRHQVLNLEPLVVGRGQGPGVSAASSDTMPNSRVRTFNPDGGGSVSNASSVGQAGSG